MNIKKTLRKIAISVAGSWRRNFLLVFRPGYVKKMRENRIGQCRMCGTCCKIVFKCPHLDKNNLCRKHETGKKPFECRYAPITPRDVADFNSLMPEGMTCGFSFAPPEE